MVPIITSYLDFLIFLLKELIYSPTLKYSSCSENEKYSIPVLLLFRSSY